jgi:hypothetical protein
MQQKGNKMLKILENRLVDGLKIFAVNECHSKYKVVLGFHGETVLVELPKTCAPNCQAKVADFAIKTAMIEIYMRHGDLEKAREWFNK